jgi:hypothetical protein
MKPQIMDRAASDIMSGARDPVSNARNVILIRATHHDAFTMRRIMSVRASWLDYLSITQRRWQRETRRPSHARHHDSIDIRERYVRCI